MNNNSETTVLLDYEEKKNMAIVVDKFIKQEMVYKLNTEAKFTIYSDVYQEPYPKLPMAALPYEANQVTSKMGKLEQKLLFSELLKKQEKVNEWPSISKQITGKIAGMLSGRAHEKIKSVYYDKWSESIKSGKVHKVIDMIRNGLVSKAARIREFDKLNLEREIMNFSRLSNETTSECNERLTEMISRATSMECKVMEKKRLILLYLYANKRHFGEKNLITIESYIDSKIRTFENKAGNFKSTLKTVMRGLLDAEETNKQYQDRAEPTTKSTTNKMEVEAEEPTAMATSKSDENSTRAKSADEGEKQKTVKTNRYSGNKFRNNNQHRNYDDRPGTSRWYNEKNINTMVAATKMVSEGKFKSLEDAVRNIQCAACEGKYHVQADCRRNSEKESKTYSRTNNYNNKNSYNKARDVYMIHQALATLDKHNYEDETNNKNVLMVSEMNDTQLSGMIQYNKWRYNIDNHCNVVIFNNSELVTDIKPVKVVINGYGGESTLKYSCVHEIFGPGYYDPNSPYNLLGLKPLEKLGFIEFKPKEANNRYTYLVHDHYGDIKFDRTKSDFYTLGHEELISIIHHNTKERRIAFSTTKVLDREYTDEEYTRAEDTMQLHRRLGHPSNLKLQAILDNNLIVNTILTGHDVRRMQSIFGNCETCNAVKPIKVTHQFPTYNPITYEIGQVMHMDIVFLTKSILYLLTVERMTNYLKAYRITTKNDISDQIYGMLAYAKLRGHTITLIRPDSDSVLISKRLQYQLAAHNPPVDIKASIPLEHEKLAESNMGRIRIKMKLIAYELKYILPAIFLTYLFMHAIDTLNMCPNNKIKSNSPAQLYDGVKPNIITDITIAFGSPCIVANTTDIDTITPNHVVAIALGRAHTHVGGVYVWIPGSTKILIRRVLKYTKLTTAMIAILHTLDPAGPEYMKNPKKNNNNKGEKTDTTSELTATKISEENMQTNDTHKIIDKNSHIVIDNNSNNNDNNSQIKLVITNNSNNNDNNSHLIIDNNKQNNGDNNHSIMHNNESHQITNNNRSQILSNDVYKRRYASNDTPRKEHKGDSKDNTNAHTMMTRSRRQIFAIIANKATDMDVEFNQYINNMRILAADYDEMKQIIDFRTFKFLKQIRDRDESIHTKVLPCHMVRTIKYNQGVYVKNKSRLTAGGNHADINNYTINSTSSPTVSHETLMMQLTIAVNKGYKVASIDYQAAFLNAPSKTGEKHVMRLNKHEALIICTIDPKLKQYLQGDGTIFVQLEKTLYGLPEAGKCWFEMLSTLLIELGFQQCIHEQPLFKRGEDIITVHVDDLLLVYGGDLDTEIMQYFQRKNIALKIKYLTQTTPLEHLGVVLELNNDGTISLQQKHYIETYIINEYQPTKTYVTPALNTNHSLIEDPKQANTQRDPLDTTPIDKALYLKKLMRLYYIAARTRPDILAAVSYASVITEPTVDDDKKLDRIIGYIAGTSHLKLHITHTDLKLFGQFDAAFATHTDFKSHSGKIVYLGTVPIWFKSNKQKLNTKASAHAELNAMYEGLDVLLWLRAILNFLVPEFNNNKPVTVYQDNQSTIKIAQLGKASTKSKSRYINCRTFWIKDLIDNNEIDIEYLPSEQIVADALASIRTGSDFTTFRSNMQVYTTWNH